MICLTIYVKDFDFIQAYKAEDTRFMRSEPLIGILRVLRTVSLYYFNNEY